MSETIEFSPPLNQVRNLLRGMTSFSLDGQPTKIALTDRNLTASGKEMAVFLKGRRIIDLGCGQESSTLPLRRFAKICGASEYVGVDLIHTPTKPGDDILPTTFVTADVLKYLSVLEPANDTVFILSGIDARPSELSDTYFSNVAKQLERVCQPNSTVIIGSYTHELNLETTFEVVHEYRDIHSSTGTKILRPRK